MRRIMPRVLLLLFAAAVPAVWAQTSPPGPVRWTDVADRQVAAADHRIAYGEGPLQFGDLRLPAGEGPHPVAVVIHGGCWLSKYDLRHISHLSEALTRAGVATWTIEYRRIGDPGGGWTGTFEDVAAGADRLRAITARFPLDLERVVLVGHSAGGHLALWAAARGGLPAGSAVFGEEPLAVRGVVALAAISDLGTFARGAADCNAAVRPLLGGSPGEVPERYRQASPIERLPLRVPVRLVHGAADPHVPIEQSRAFAAQARAAGDDVELVEIPAAAHFDLIAPWSPAWSTVEGVVLKLVGRQASLGTVSFPVTCSIDAQLEFSRAVALLHHMTYPQARQAFERAAALDPRCAMAHWGIAMTLFQPLWPTRPSPDALRRGWEAVQTARSLQPPTERERLMVAAAEAFFAEPGGTDYWLRIRRWERAAQTAFSSLPDDPEAATFYALAHLAVAPSDTISRAHADKAAEILLRVYEANPDHPGAMHYLVHANDVPGREGELLEVTRKYEMVAPHNPHALHMPTHIYTRLGDWNAVIRGNLKAADAALDHRAGEHGEFVWDEFPHAIEYLVYASLQKGADLEAAAQLERLHATTGLEPTFKTAFHLASTRVRYTLERRAWDEALALAPRQPSTLDWERYTWPEAIAWFARGLGAAHLGRTGESRAARERLQQLEETTDGAGEKLFARNIKVLRLELDAWIAHRRGDKVSGIELMREAAELERSTPKHAVTPAPTIPAYELLGDLLLAQQRPAEALVEYQRSLQLYPRRFNSLLGAARAARQMGNDARARGFYQELLDVADEGATRAALTEARRAVGRRP
jgi:acetyl esterase/lipase